MNSKHIHVNRKKSNRDMSDLSPYMRTPVILIQSWRCGDYKMIILLLCFFFFFFFCYPSLELSGKMVPMRGQRI